MKTRSFFYIRHADWLTLTPAYPDTQVGETTFGGATSAQCEAGYTKVDIEDDSTVSAGSATISILRCVANQSS